MGVPKFYRWVSERYPCLSEVVKEFQIPEFDNLYLDMNGIVHVCSHPEDDNPHFRITEEKIFSDIMHYLEFLFRMIKPRKVFFMAVDGVAPRAKMNQQRGRRFRSAREAEDLERKAKEKGEVLPTEKRFDSNCITPGTPFMVRLQEQLKYFVVNKLSTDPLWHGVRVYLSGHETPGEGEHKIMDFIRAERSQQGYDPNTRHCLYGLDADLMMLGLATHEPHFALLREEVRFGGSRDKTKRPATPEETTFHLLHLQLFREYLDFEFSALRDVLPFGYNLENIIDDWVLMGFLVGNDFIPHLPNLHINHDALPLLWQTYIQVLPECGGYINNGGKLNLERFEKYMKKLSEFDMNTFAEQAGDLKWLEGKKGAAQSETERQEMMSAARKMRKNIKKTENQFAMLDKMSGTFEDFMELGTDLADSDPEISEDISDEDSSDDTLDDEFRHHKRNYYMTKMEYEKVTPEVLRDQAEGYVRGIQWILLYYYEGVPSWSWFYPHHYAPYMSDVKDFKNMNLEFEYGRAFKPFEQLMAVLPAASKELLPPTFQKLMVNDNSPVLDFYPLEFLTDLNGKQQDWEAVVLIPFIEEERLLAAMKTAENEMTDEERSRNVHGPCLLYEYQSEPLPPYRSHLPEAFPDIAVSHAKLTEIPIELFRLSSNEIVKGLMPETRLDVFFPGFPTLKHIKHTAELSKDGVKVFQMSSRGYNVMLNITEQDTPEIERVAKEYLGKEIFVGWPHLYEARVVTVCDHQHIFSIPEQPSNNKKNKAPPSSTQGQIKRENSDHNTSNIWNREVASIAEKYRNRLGVLVGETDILVRALPMTGRKYIYTSHGRITMEKQFGTRPVPFALQATVKDIAVHDSSFCQFNTLKEYLPEGAAVFMLAWPHYGCQGEVIETDPEAGRVRINLTTFEEPNLDKIINTQQYHEVRYYQSYELAQRLGISSYLVTRLTGTIFINAGNAELAREQQNPHRVSVGLNLKFTKKGEEVPGYTKMVEGKWCYSEKTQFALRDYMNKYTELFTGLARADSAQKLNSENLYESELLPNNCSYTLKDVQSYLKSLPCHGIKAMKMGADIISEGLIKAIQEEANRVVEINKKRQKRVKMQVKPHLLFRPLPTSGALIPDSSTQYQLYDRVCNIRQGFPVPFGLRGTVIGIHPADVEVNTMYEVLFDEDFPGGIEIRSSGHRGYRMPPSGLLNLTHGERKFGVRPPVPPAQQQATNQSGQHGRDQPRYGLQANNRGASMGNNRGWERNQPTNSHHDNQQWAKGANPPPGRTLNNAGSETSDWRSGKDQNRNQPSDQSRNQHSDQNRNQYSDQSGNQSNRGSETSNWRTASEQSANQSSMRPSQGGGNKQGNSRVQGTTDGVFNGSGGPLPKFVTPRVNQSGTRRSSQGDPQGAGPSGKSTGANTSSEFGDMWKQLQSGESGQGTSLSQAAAVLPVVTSLDQNTNNSNMSMKIDVQSLFCGATQKVSIGDDIVGNKTVDKSVANERKKQATGGGQSKPSSKIVSNDEFAAMFKSLEAMEVKNTEEVDGKSKAGQEVGNAILVKKVLTPADQLEAPSDTAAPPGGKKEYGKQLSVQELFAGAQQQQQQEVTNNQQQQMKNKSNKQKPQQQQPTQQQHHQQQQKPMPWQQGFPGGNVQQQGYQSRPPLLAAPVHAGNSNPVMELMNYCQTQRLELPFYNNVTKNGQYICEVTLFNGARFMGSLCKSKEEAAESAASVALLQLKSPLPQQMGGAQMMRMPGMPAGYVPGILPQGRQISSPNSAFIPVNTYPGNQPGQYPGQSGRGQYHGYQPRQQQRPHGRGQGHGYPYQSNQGNFRQQMPQQHHYQAPNQPNAYQSQQFQQQQQYHHQQDQHQNASVAQPNLITREEVTTAVASQKSSKTSVPGAGEVKTCVVTPFVPLQVVKKQTPTKPRKEIVVTEPPVAPKDSTVPSNNEPRNHRAPRTDVPSSRTDISANNKSNNAHTVAADATADRQGAAPASVGKSHVTRDSSKTPERPASLGQTPSSGKKSKRRLAANFANLQS